MNYVYIITITNKLILRWQVSKALSRRLITEPHEPVPSTPILKTSLTYDAMKCNTLITVTLVALRPNVGRGFLILEVSIFT
jgi:hypothetical protein